VQLAAVLEGERALRQDVRCGLLEESRRLREARS
jgi:hypothetical protein